MLRHAGAGGDNRRHPARISAVSVDADGTHREHRLPNAPCRRRSSWPPFSWKSGQSPFSAEALIVAAWQKYPQTFGLKGYAEQYPDSNKVLTSIMGEKGLARRGWLVKMGQKLYALTREGRQVVRRLLPGRRRSRAAGRARPSSCHARPGQAAAGACSPARPARSIQEGRKRS